MYSTCRILAIFRVGIGQVMKWQHLNVSYLGNNCVISQAFAAGREYILHFVAIYIYK